MCVGINFQEYLTVEKYWDRIEVEVQNVGWWIFAVSCDKMKFYMPEAQRLKFKSIIGKFLLNEKLQI